MTRKRRTDTFADMVARAKAQPQEAPMAPVGLHAEVWGDPSGVAYSLVDDALSPAGALRLVAAGARVVFDACGCGGAECVLEWVSVDDALALGRSGGVPLLRPSRDGLATLEHWRAESGAELVIVSGDVSWGDRIPG